MNQPNKPESSKLKWLWALLALFIVASVGMAILAFTLVKKSGVKVLSLGAGAITPIDLMAFYDKSGSLGYRQRMAGDTTRSDGAGRCALRSERIAAFERPVRKE
jgi:hypothetical protein